MNQPATSCRSASAQTKRAIKRLVCAGRRLVASLALLPGASTFSQQPGTPAPSVQPQEIRDIAPPVDVFPYPIWMVVTAAVVLLALVALIAWWIIRRINTRPAAPPPTSREIALRELELARGRMGVVEPYEFSIIVSDILRAYVSAQFRLRATQQTSPEFLAVVSGSAKFSDNEKTLLAAFLDKCDLIKFARLEATGEDCSELLRQATAFVEGGAA
jgi:hypothetical protein